MRYLLKLSQFALILFVLLITQGEGVSQPKVKTGKNQNRIDVATKQVNLYGVIGISHFQGGITIQAGDADIEELAFLPNNLKETSKGQVWLTPSNVQITPDIKSIKKGRSQEYLITVQNITEPGLYSGTIAISFKGQSADAKDSVSVSVRAVKFNGVPPQLLLRFEKCLICSGNPEEAPITLSLNEEKQQLSQDLREILEKSMSTSLAPLINSEDKSQTISPKLIYTPNTEAPVAGVVDRGLVLKYILTNPQATAGKYTGNLIVDSKDVGTLINVPVEVQIRYPQWLAWVLILGGVVTSLFISRWNTIGKKKNAIQSKAYRLWTRLDAADITTGCREQIKGDFDQLQELLDRDDLDSADKLVNDAHAKLALCINEKKALRNKSVEVQALMNEFGGMEARVKNIALPDAAILQKYLPSIRASLEQLKNDIDQEIYPNVNDALNEMFTAQKKMIGDLAGPVLNGFNELENDLRRLVTDYRIVFEEDAEAVRAGLEVTYIQPIKRHISGIISDTDVVQVVSDIKNANDDFTKADRVIRALTSYDGLIKRLKQQGVVTTKAETAMTACRSYLSAGDIALAESNLVTIKTAIEEASSQRADSREVANLNRVLRFSVFDDKVSTTGRDHDETESAPVIRESDSQPSWISQFSGWLTPEQQGTFVNALLWLVVISILTVIGFSQLYDSNPIFGSKNVWVEYLTLFLWGFSIQTGTATVSDVIKTFRGA